MIDSPSDATAIPPPSPADVTVVVLTHDGRHHLGPCLEALERLQGLAGPASVLVADNASSDGTGEWLAQNHALVRSVRFEENLGFAEGNNRAVEEHVSTPWVLLLNNDTAIAPDALERLCAALAEGGVCAGARLADWSGRKLDFDGGAMSWTGHGHALGHGSPVPRSAAAPHPTFFVTGAAMLVHRATFVALGGFDPAYFAYYEDVDFGWRLLLSGHEPLHVPSAVVRHRGGGSARTFDDDRRGRLHERNALCSVAKNYGDESLDCLLPAALALAAVRAGAPKTVIDAASSAVGSSTVIAPSSDPAGHPPLPLPAADWPGWPYLEPLELDWPAVQAARRTVQALRRRADRAVIDHFAIPWAPVPPTATGWASLRRADECFGVADWVGPRPRPTPGRRLIGRLARTWRAGGAGGVGGAARAWWALRRGGGR